MGCRGSEVQILSLRPLIEGLVRELLLEVKALREFDENPFTQSILGFEGSLEALQILDAYGARRGFR